ncbi:Helicase ARIP4 [Halotydeus destructor]|nr:Helicase ARIP4 [Halotydeus destructor]
MTSQVCPAEQVIDFWSQLENTEPDNEDESRSEHLSSPEAEANGSGVDSGNDEARQSDDDENEEEDGENGEGEEDLGAEDTVAEESKETKVKGKRKKSQPANLRRNIKKIMLDTSLTSETINARKEEEDRIKRLAETQKELSRQLKQQLLSGGSFEVKPQEKSRELICLSSDEEAEAKNADIVELSDGEDYSNDNMDDRDDEEGLDINNCGIHVDDNLNIRDGEGRVLINPAHPSSDEDVFLAENLSHRIKPHQIGGLRFLYDNIIENQQKFKAPTSGLGCILAHSMGLGKTFQIVSFTDIFIKVCRLCESSSPYVLIIVPINTLQNWISEFEMWLPSQQKIDEAMNGDRSSSRRFKVFALGSDIKSYPARAKEILAWRKEGGVLLLGYELYRILAEDLKIGKKNHEGLDISSLRDLDEQVKQAIINPGPDLVVCDEGHRIKNCRASISKFLKLIKTKRRIVLTGYPLQNNLLEYWCMVDFVRPNFLGSEKDFSNMFDKPIKNGQCNDSTPHDRQLMKYRSHVLYSLLRGFVQRRSHTILKKTLPIKHEHVILLRMTDIQKRLMVSLFDYLKNDPLSISGSVKINPIVLFSICNKIWNHPDILFNIVNEGMDILDLDVEVKTNKSSSRKSKKSQAGCSSTVDEFTMPPQVPNARTNYAVKDRVIDYDWARMCFAGYIPNLIQSSHKTSVTFDIINQVVEQNEKLLIFSQSLYTLDLIEKFLSRQYVPGLQETWCRNQNYFRLDGSTSSSDREKIINRFNKDSSVHLFLLSTRAGCLGINLIGANRIIIFDASWNPCHDAQAACRIYRYGQQKECFIYRLVCDNSLEKKIYDRQVNKQGIAHRIIDEMNTESHFASKEITTLIEDLSDLREPPMQYFSQEMVDLYSDEVIKHLCERFAQCLTKPPFEHESLLLENHESKLSAAEKERARRNYQEAKSQNQFNRRFTVYNHGNMDGLNLPSQSTPTPGAHSQYLANLCNQLSLPNSAVYGSGYTETFNRLQRQGYTQHRNVTLNRPLVLRDKNSGQNISLPPGDSVSVFTNSQGTSLMLTRDCKVIDATSVGSLLNTDQSRPVSSSSIYSSGSTNLPSILRKPQPRPVRKPQGPPELISLSDDEDSSTSANSTCTINPAP